MSYNKYHSGGRRPTKIYNGYLLTISPYTYKVWCSCKKLLVVLAMIKYQCPHIVFHPHCGLELAPKKKTLHLHVACCIPPGYDTDGIKSYIKELYHLHLDFQKKSFKSAINYSIKEKNRIEDLEERYAHHYWTQPTYLFQD